MKSGRPLAAGILVVILVVCGWVIRDTTFVSDLSAFMPRDPTKNQKLLLEQIRYGSVGRLIMVGIEGGTPAERARAAQSLSSSLRRNTALFSDVQDGDKITEARDRAYLFDNRYLLSPGVRTGSFSVSGMRHSIRESIDALDGSAGLLLARIFPRDPTGETAQVLSRFAGTARPRSEEGAWTSRNGKIALLLVQTNARGSDIESQANAVHRIRKVFAEQNPGSGLNLLMSGTPVFAVAARATIEGEITRLALAGTGLVTLLLLSVYRSPTLLLLSIVPVAVGAVVAIATVSIGFGNVHSLTLAFGTTLIGEAVDYSIYFLVQRFDNLGGPVEPDFWRTIRLGVLTSAAGYSVLLFSGFSSLAQLGLYSISGLVVAALVARFALPRLAPTAVALPDIDDVGARIDHVFSTLGRHRWIIVVVGAAAIASISSHAGTIWNRKLMALSPIAKKDQKIDELLRTSLGVSDMRYVAASTATTEDDAIREAEMAGGALQRAVERREIAGFLSPAFVLPSVEEQHRRQSAIPRREIVLPDLRQAVANLPVRARDLAPFIHDLQVSRSRSPIRRPELRGTSFQLLVDSLLIKRPRDYLVLLPLRAVSGDRVDIRKINRDLRASGLQNVRVIDILDETTRLFEGYLHESLSLVAVGAVLIIGILLATLRSATRTLRIVTPLACAVLSVTATLVALGVGLTIFHLIGLLLVVAIGSNYALFFDATNRHGDNPGRYRTNVSIVVANLTAVASFGILGFSRVPVLTAIGTTVGLGAFLALIYSAMLTRSSHST